MRIIVKSKFKASQDDMFELLMKRQTLVFISHPYVTFEAGAGWRGEWREDIEYNLRPMLFGHAPASDHFVTFTKIDRSLGVLETTEYGDPITRWDHFMRVVELGQDRCEYVDVIDVEGVWPDWCLRLFVWSLYMHRHRRWKKLLKLQRRDALPQVFA